MITYFSRKELSIDKYDQCISDALNTRIYAYSWYLDIVADNWGALVLNDYEAVMPLPWREKYFIKYIYPPFWVLELGIFYNSKSINETIFLEEAGKHFKFIEHRMSTNNSLIAKSINAKPRQFQCLALAGNYKEIKNNFRKDRHKDLRRALEKGLVAKWNDNPEYLIELFRKNIGKRIPNIIEKDYQVLLNLMVTCIKENVGEIISVYDKTNIVASAFLLKYGETVAILISSTDLNNRKHGANTFLIDRAIFKFNKAYSTFNFGGSSMSTIASYFKSFGAYNEEYWLLKQNKLPPFLRWLKK